MRPIVRLVLLLATVPAAGSAAWAGPWATETVFVPTSGSILYEPTAYSYYTPTGYVTTDYYVPTTYSLGTTAYVVPTSYAVPARYAVRRYRPTTYAYTYAPTTYYLPTTTTLDLPVLTTTSRSVACCGATVAAAPACETIVAAPVERPLPPVNGNAGATSSATNPDASGNDVPQLDSSVINSTPLKPRPKPSAPAPTPPPADSVDPPSGPTNTEEPIVPAPDATGPAGLPPLGTRDSLKPKLSTARSALNGRVLAGDTGNPEKGLAVVIANAGSRFRDRTATTDDQGRFSVVLPEGDWTVKVPKASGGTIDREVTVSGGLVTDDQDREVSSLTVNR